MEINRWKIMLSMLSVLMLVLAAGSQAGEIDLDKPVSKGKGSVVFSFTIHGALESRSTVKWRSLERLNEGGDISVNQDAWFGNETFSKMERKVIGRFVRLELPAGEYEFYSFGSSSFIQNRWFLNSGSRGFSRRFSVKADKSHYIGNLDILAMPPEYGAGGRLSGAFFGTYVGTVDFYPSLQDAGKIDLPMLASQNVTIDEALAGPTPDEIQTEQVIRVLKAHVDAGDVAAKKILLAGLSNGWFMNENGEEFKLDPDPELKARLVAELERAGVPGGAFALADADYQKWAYQVPKELDGAKIRSRYLADANKYYWPAMSKIAQAYNRSLPGADRDSELAWQWEERLKALELPTRQAIPYLDDAGKQEYDVYRSASDPRYFAVSMSGAYGMSAGDTASSAAAIKACEARNEGSSKRCRLYATKRNLVWDACPIELAGPEATTMPTPSRKGKITIMTSPPKGMSKPAKALFKDFLASIWPRAYAYAENGEAAMASGDCQSAYRALQRCRELTGQTCQLYALDDQLVQDSADPQLAGEAQRLSVLVEQASQGKAQLASQSAPAIKQMEKMLVGKKTVQEGK